MGNPLLGDANKWIEGGKEPRWTGSRLREPVDGDETLRRVCLGVKLWGEREATTSTASHGRQCTELGDREQLSIRSAYQNTECRTTGIENPGNTPM